MSETLFSGLYLIFISLGTMDIKKHTLSAAPVAIIDGKLNSENTADFGDMIHTNRSDWRYAGEL